MSRLRHVVMFGFADDAKSDQVDEIVRRFAALKTAIPGIRSFEWGINNSPEGLDRGLSHCFVLTFDSETDRDAYLPHPEHLAFTEFVRPYIAHVTVLDYWAEHQTPACNAGAVHT